VWRRHRGQDPGGEIESADASGAVFNDEERDDRIDGVSDAVEHLDGKERLGAKR
jgi:hypothetical protein